MITGGLLLIAVGLRRRPAPPPRPSPRLRLPNWLAGMPRWQRTAAVAAFVAGISAAAAATGWVVLVVLLPLAVVGLPSLLATSDAAPRIARMEAIAEWTRNLSGVLTAGQALEQALHASLRSTPDAIRPGSQPVIAGRLRARWSTAAALRAFADDLDDATGDLVVAALILGSCKRGRRARAGAHRAGRVRRRGREGPPTARSRPGRTALQRSHHHPDPRRRADCAGTVGQFLAPFGTALGQVLLALYLAAYVGCAVWLKRLAAEPAAVRFVAPRTEVRR